MNAAVERLNDLREADKETFAARDRRIDDIMTARDILTTEKHNRQDDMRIQESSHLKDVAQIRAQYDEQLRGKETERIDAIRSVDVAAVQRASEVAAIQAATLATQVQTSAEALRNQVAAAATAAATALATALEPLQKSIDELRRIQYENIGKSGLADPQLEELKSAVQRLATSQSTQAGVATVRDPQTEEIKAQLQNLISAQAVRQGSGSGQSQLIGWIFGAIGASVGIVVLIERLIGK